MKRPKQSSPTPPETTPHLPATDKLSLKDLLDKLPDDTRKALDKLPESERTILIERVCTTLIASSDSLPSPQKLREYDEVVPGSAERIFRMEEKEQNQRITWVKETTTAEIRQEQYGQWFGFLIAVLCICGAVYLAMNGQVLVPSILAGSTVLGLAGRFIQSKKDSS